MFPFIDNSEIALANKMKNESQARMEYMVANERCQRETKTTRRKVKGKTHRESVLLEKGENGGLAGAPGGCANPRFRTFKGGA